MAKKHFEHVDNMKSEFNESTLNQIEETKKIISKDDESNTLIIDNVKYYTLVDIAKLFHVSTRTALEYVRLGKIKANKIGGKWYINNNAINEYMNKNQSH